MSCIVLWCTIYPFTYLYLPINYLPTDQIAQDLFLCNVANVNNLPRCPVFPNNLESYVRVNKDVNKSLIDSLAKIYKVAPGGQSVPVDCLSRQKVAVIIPYRNREQQLLIFLQHMIPILHKQLVDYQLFIIEQSEELSFNRGMLFNVGFKEALKFNNFCCFIFHDVDLLPLNENHIFSCSANPRHMCSALDKFRFRLTYDELFGGAVAFPKEIFERINGYSNKFFGWGGEDDDFFIRLKMEKIPITRWEPSISLYAMLHHKAESQNPNRFNLLKESRRNYKTDGLNSMKYSIVRSEMRPLYTWILANLTS